MLGLLLWFAVVINVSVRLLSTCMVERSWSALPGTCLDLSPEQLSMASDDARLLTSQTQMALTMIRLRGSGNRHSFVIHMPFDVTNM